jgi:hypothetical protein
MEPKVELYRAKAVRLEQRAKNERGKNARKWQLTVARAYRVLATEAETAVQQFAPNPNKEQLETAERRLLDGCRIVAQQRAKVGRLKDQGNITAEAEKTLRTLEECLANFENQLELLQLQMAPSSSIAGFIF